MSKATTETQNDRVVVKHGSFSVERTYPQSPARVFFALSDEASARRWRGEGEGFILDEFKVDFRVGGGEVSRFRVVSGPALRMDTTYHDIVADQRMIFTIRMEMENQPMSVSLVTVELFPSGKGTLLKYTEQGAYFNDDLIQGREEGTRQLLGKLADELARPN